METIKNNQDYTAPQTFKKDIKVYQSKSKGKEVLKKGDSNYSSKRVDSHKKERDKLRTHDSTGKRKEEENRSAVRGFKKELNGNYKKSKKHI